METLNVPQDKFVDTVCHQKTFSSHLNDVDCHYTLMLENTSNATLCSISVPYPVGKIFLKPTALPPPIFQMEQYMTRLLTTKCTAVFKQYSTTIIHEAIAAGHPIKPSYVIAPMRTSILFFNPTTASHTDKPYIKVNGRTALNKASAFSITPDALLTINHQSLPTYFTWMDNIEITRPVDQGVCGSCWAIAATTGLSDVFVVSQKIPNPKLSHDYVLSCYPQNQCEGGNPFLAISDMELTGGRNSSCIEPNNATISSNIPQCKCVNPSPTFFPMDTRVICIPPDLNSVSMEQAKILQSFLLNLYGVNDTVNLSNVSYTNIQKIIQHHIYTYGPVISGFHVFKNFMKGDYRETNDIYIESESYQGVEGIHYDDLEKDWIGSHAVVIVGWGEDLIKDTNVRYWIVRNSWGAHWGINGGLFKIAMYGTTPYQNRISQFEYPSVISSDSGYGVAGGVLLVKAGIIITSSMDSILPVSSRIPIIIRSRRWTLFILLIISILMLYLGLYVFPKNGIALMFLITTSVFIVALGSYQVQLD